MHLLDLLILICLAEFQIVTRQVFDTNYLIWFPMVYKKIQNGGFAAIWVPCQHNFEQHVILLRSAFHKAFLLWCVTQLVTIIWQIRIILGYI